MALKFNPATGQTEDDSPGLLGQVADVVGTIAPPLGAAMKLAPMMLDEGTPAAPEPTAAPPPAPMPAAPPMAPAAPSPTTAIPTPHAPPATETLSKDSSTSTRSTTGTVVSPEMRAADKDVKAATDQGAKALELEATNRLKQAEIDQAKQEIEATAQRKMREHALNAEKEANARKVDIDAQAKRDQDAYQVAAAAGDKGFWGSQDVVTKKQWALSLMFGNIAGALGAENTGQRLLDKTMHDWTTERDKKLARLERQAEQSGGLQQTFWREYGAEYKERSKLQEGAAYASAGDQIDALGAKMKNLIPAQAAATNAAKAAEYWQKAATLRQAVVDSRASRFTNSTTDVSTTTTGMTAAQIAQADKTRSETLLDLDGNVVGRALSKEEGEKIRKGHAAATAFVDTIDRLKAFNSKNGTRIISPDLIQQRDLLTGEATSYLTQAFQTGTLQDAEFKRYSKLLQGGWLQSGDGANTGLSGLQQGVRNAYGSQLRSQGVKVGEQPAGAGGGDIVEVRNKKTGQIVKARRGPDGQLHPVQ
jgi:hypothetical protein